VTNRFQTAKPGDPGDLTDWSVKRSGNLDRMLAEARRDDGALYGRSTEMLDALSGLLTTVGDEAGALYVASLARLLEQKGLRTKRRPR
jgi:hypothetical protein